MGSDSDWPTMSAATEALTDFGVAHEVEIVSAHRTPKRMIEFAEQAAGRGIRVIIAGAGGAAHLPGMIASCTTLPVVGVPVPLKNLFASFGISGLIVVFLYYLIFVAFIGLAVAPLIGEHAASKWAEKKEGDIQKGCQRSGKHSVCTALTREGKVVGAGLIIASSTTHIAFFDIAAKHGRLIKFEDGELTGWVP